ncbi:alpha/beta hydrolase [Ruminococcaceae bacterium OttesenSCG-928-L11]|nr:alpha/beta hydrolase [Ruminococcaceae bacterium OttesenSCG-928-L11]
MTYVENPLRPTSFLMKRVAEKNATLMRGLPIAEQREAKSALADIRMIMPWTDAVEVECSGVPCLWVYRRDACPADRVILYLHGGSWIFGDRKTAKAFGVMLAEMTGYRVLVAEYRLAPEHPYPAGLDDSFAVYNWLLDSGFSPDTIALFGDSAGGNLCLCLTNRLRRLGMPTPACIGLASPVTDARKSAAIVSSGIDLIHTVHNGKEWDIFSLYLHREGQEEPDRSHPEISPIVANLAGFPPILVHSGEDEAITADNIAFVEKAYAQGVNAHIKIYGGMFHDFTIVGRTLAESRWSVREMASFFRGHLGMPEETEAPSPKTEAVSHVQ